MNFKKQAIKEKLNNADVALISVQGDYRPCAYYVYEAKPGLFNFISINGTDANFLNIKLNNIETNDGENFRMWEDCYYFFNLYKKI